jgi:dTDP-4-amino-4,6-dideoxygalactose transaminase
MIPIMKPLLPDVDSLYPYIKRIDISRWYSDWGELALEFERRLADMFKCHVVCCSSATTGLTAALMAVLPFNYKTRAMVGVPSWTFCATISAIFAAGFRPLIMDVHNDGLGNKNVLNTSSGGGCRAFVPVMPLGAPIDFAGWNNFSREFCPVVIDGAAGFDVLISGRKIGKAPIVVSTHSTKVLSTAEGGFILSSDEELIAKIRRILKQGMLPDKNISELGINGKMSEYHAAIGLAELDNWKEKRSQWAAVQQMYGEDKCWVSSTHDELLPEGVEAAKVVEALAKKGIMARASWYGIAHKQDAYMKIWLDAMNHDGTIKMKMEKTEELARRTIFLPKYVDMKASEIEYVKESLKLCLL